MFTNKTRGGWTLLGLRHDRPFHRSYYSAFSISLNLVQAYEHHIVQRNSQFGFSLNLVQAYEHHIVQRNSQFRLYNLDRHLTHKADNIRLDTCVLTKVSDVRFLTRTSG